MSRAALEKRLRELEDSERPEDREEFARILEENNGLMMLYKNKWKRHKLPGGDLEWPVYGNDVYLFLFALLCLMS